MTSGGSSYEWKEAYSSKSTSGDTSKEGRCCQTDVVFDKRYLTGIPGVLKYIEIVRILNLILCIWLQSFLSIHYHALCYDICKVWYM